MSTFTSTLAKRLCSEVPCLVRVLSCVWAYCVEVADSYELMADAQRDIAPEQAAGRLGACLEVHYLDAKLRHPEMMSIDVPLLR
jgi:hypothetical protein